MVSCVKSSFSSIFSARAPALSASKP
jgi:hypothetical protein